MNNTNNPVKKKDKRTEALTAGEIEILEKCAKEAKSFSSFAIDLRIERTALLNTIARHSASPLTVKKIRRFLQKQPA